MSKLQIKLLASAVALVVVVLTNSTAASAQQFLEPVNSLGGSQDFLNMTGPDLSEFAPQDAPANVSPAKIYQFERADENFNKTQYFLPDSPQRGVTLPISSTPGMLPGAPFTASTRRAIEKAAGDWINAQVDAHGLHRSQQVLQRDQKLEDLLAQDQSKLGANYATLQAQEQLIDNQDMSLISGRLGHDITAGQQKLLNQEENDLSSEIKSLAGN